MSESTHHNYQPVSNQHLTPLIPSAPTLHSVRIPSPLILSTPCTFQPSISARSSLLLPPKTQPIIPALYSPMLHTNIQSTFPLHSSFLFPPLSLSGSILLIQASAKHLSASFLFDFYISGNIFFRKQYTAEFLLFGVAQKSPITCRPSPHSVACGLMMVCAILRRITLEAEHGRCDPRRWAGVDRIDTLLL